MAKYNDTKFYWLQLKEDFFEDDAIEWLEEQQPNGRDYAYFYLKLCLKSLKTNGVLIREVGNVLIPYDNKKLAELTRMDFDTVTVAMELLKKIGLVEILESGEIYISQLENLIGSQSVGAFKKQRQRMLKNDGGGQMSALCPPKIEIELEKELEIDKEKEIDKEREREKKYEIIQTFKPNLSNLDYEMINEVIDDYSIEQIQNAIDIAITNNAKVIKYFIQVLKNPNYKPTTQKAPRPKWLDEEIKNERRELTNEEQELYQAIINGTQTD